MNKSMEKSVLKLVGKSMENDGKVQIITEIGGKIIETRQQ